MATAADRDTLRLADTFRNLFYTPVYVAVGGGFLHRQGLDVHLSTVPSGVDSITLLKDGTADVLQSGLSRSFMDLDEGNEDAPVHVAETNQRDGFFLVSRTPVKDWTWNHLDGSTIIPVGFTPVPWATLRYAMKSRGVDVGRVRLIEGLPAEEALSRFRAGDADYIQMVNPFAQQLIGEGSGYLAAGIGTVLGYVCYSSLAVSPSFANDRPDTIQRFVRGFHEAQTWLAASEYEAVADVVAPFFPAVGGETLERSIQRYKSQQTWAEDPLIGEDGFTAIRDILIDGGLVKNTHAYNRVVRPEFALEAMKG